MKIYSIFVAQIWEYFLSKNLENTAFVCENFEIRYTTLIFGDYDNDAVDIIAKLPYIDL